MKRTTPKSAGAVGRAARPEARNASQSTVLLAVSGMSPAILTETVWALAHPGEGQEPIVPEQVIVLTTSRGAGDLERVLRTPRADWNGRCVWECLREAILAQPAFRDRDREKVLQLATPRVIELPDPKSGVKAAAADLRSAADNAAAADFILEEVRRLVSNPDTRVIASIAGGRKTMGALLYSCMSLLGRETDRLTHVLVSSPFEECRDFFYPDQPMQELVVGKAQQGVRAAEARIELADIPFIPLRNLFRKELGRPAGGFMRLVASCQEDVRRRVGESLRLTVSTPHRHVEVNGARLDLPAREHLLLLFLASRLKQGEPPLPSQKDALDPLDEFRIALGRQARPDDLSDWRRADSLAVQLDEDDLRRALSSLRGKLREAGADGADLASCLPLGHGSFGLDLPGGLVFIK
jgi:CRISPR-associated protein (TIGR02584 family)